jgi:hypothetical protein
MPKSEDQKWRMEVNERYQKVVDTVVNLATASLVLPILFFRSFLGVPEDKPILSKLNGWAYLAWALLFFSIACGMVFYYTSAKWAKIAHGQRVRFSPTTVECILDTAFWFMVGTFFAGLICLIVFAVRAH